MKDIMQKIEAFSKDMSNNGITFNLEVRTNKEQFEEFKNINKLIFNDNVTQVEMKLFNSKVKLICDLDLK